MLNSLSSSPHQFRHDHWVPSEPEKTRVEVEEIPEMKRFVWLGRQSGRFDGSMSMKRDDQVIAAFCRTAICVEVLTGWSCASDGQRRFVEILLWLHVVRRHSREGVDKTESHSQGLEANVAEGPLRRDRLLSRG